MFRSEIVMEVFGGNPENVDLFSFVLYSEILGLSCCT